MTAHWAVDTEAEDDQHEAEDAQGLADLGGVQAQAAGLRGRGRPQGEDRLVWPCAVESFSPPPV